MGIEIERKFLVANERWKTSVTQTIRIRDGLIANNNGHKARVRIANARATIALKSRRRGASRSEFEYTIPLSDAEDIMRVMCDEPILEKVRHCVPYGGVIWYVDVYEGILSGVVIAEVELDRTDQDLQLPDWVGPEVTADPNYRKINMIARRIADNREKHSTGRLG
jgi:adenylate cyclase